ncbi:MAG: aminotransferase class V-fold PLP-dependent enzyme [Bacillota bacterium]|nr:aminotransferase class V-fold PLP-dependent enzyme [Bacillota bacterium]MDW7677519.1 aminotransferase class V-fold PLP-dependent enzyme [Bacillota bacterium]
MNTFEAVRKRYPAANNQVYLDTSTTGLFSTNSYEAMKGILDKRLLSGVSIAGYWESWQAADDWRAVFAGMIGARADEIFYGKDSSDMLNTFINGIEIPAGSNVIVPDISFPATRNAWLNQERNGVAVRYMKNQGGVVTTDQVLDSIDADTFAVSICSVEPSSGYHYEIRRLGDACRERGVYLVVDATQSLGAMDLDVEEMKIDVMVASTYKWLANVFGFSVGYMRKTVIDKIRPCHVGWTGVRDRVKDFNNPALVLHEGAQKFETGGLNWLGLNGVKESVATYLSLGKKDVEDHILNLVALLYREVDKLEQVTIDPWLQEINRSGIVYLKAAEGYNWSNEFFETRKIRLNLSGDRLRIGIHFYNNEEDIRTFVSALTELLAKE